MPRLVIAFLLALVMIGCQSSPKSAEVINAAAGRTLLQLIEDYSKTYGQMPQSIYVLDLSNVRCGDRVATIADLRCVPEDRELEADFLYFVASGSLDQQDPARIVLASSFPGTPTMGRWVVRAGGDGGMLSESDFQEAMHKNGQGEQDVHGNTH